jgi:hypothetical protein
MRVSWKIIEGFNDRYSIGSTGLVMSNRREVRTGTGKREIGQRIVKQQIGFGGYSCVSLRRTPSGKNETLYVHRLVATHFCKNPLNKEYVNHIDGNKHNNNKENLEWVTASENCIHAYSLGLSSSPTPPKTTGVDRHNSKQILVLSAGVLVDMYKTKIDASRSLNICGKTISKTILDNTTIKGLKFYEIKLRKLGVTWDQVQKYIGKSEGDLPFLFNSKEEKIRSVSFC